MKKFSSIILILTCLMISLNIANAAPMRQGVIWLSYDGDTFRSQKKISSPILLFVGTQQCADCKNMWDKTLRDPKVKTYIDTHFITVISKKPEQAILKRYQIKEFPALLVLNSNGDVLEKLVGFHGIDETMKILTTASHKADAV